MPRVSRLLVPAALGIAAGVINYLVLNRGAEYKYLVAADVISAEEVVTPQKLGSTTSSFPLPYAVPAHEIQAVSGRKSAREYQRNYLLLKQDFMPVLALNLKPGEIAINVSLDGVQYEPRLLTVGNQVGFVVPAVTAADGGSDGFQVLGPYRIVAVGEDVSPSSLSSTRRRSGSTVSVAVGFEQTDQQVGSLKSDGTRLMEVKAAKEIAALALYPGDSAAPVTTVSSGASP